MLVETLPLNGLAKGNETTVTSAVQELTIHFPGKVVFGKGALNGLTGELRQMAAEKVLIITITPLLPKLQTIVEHLERSAMEVWVDTSITEEPSFEDFRNIMTKVAPFCPDVVVGIGGGSVLDIAKLVAAQLDNEQSIDDYVGIGLLKGRRKKLACLPATSGTGSEVSPNAILVDNRDQQKKGIISPFLVPDLVLVDPVLTMTVPPEVTAATGLDALIHCLEAYTNKFAHPFIDVYAYEGMRQIAANLVQAVADGTNEEARTGVSLGSLLGGFCLGPVNTAGVHALSYPLGSTFHLAHGLSNALLLPYVMEFNIPAAPQRFAHVAIALGCERAETDLATAYRGVEKVKVLMKDCGVPSRLRDLGIPEEAVPEMAAAAMKITRLLKNNPRPITENDAVAIYKAAY